VNITHPTQAGQGRVRAADPMSMFAKCRMRLPAVRYRERPVPKHRARTPVGRQTGRSVCRRAICSPSDMPSQRARASYQVDAGLNRPETANSLSYTRRSAPDRRLPQVSHIPADTVPEIEPVIDPIKPPPCSQSHARRTLLGAPCSGTMLGAHARNRASAHTSDTSLPRHAPDARRTKGGKWP